MAALLGCLIGFMTSIYLYRRTQTLTLTLTLPNLCLILTSIHTLPLNLVPHHGSAGPLVHLTHSGETVNEQWARGTVSGPQ